MQQFSASVQHYSAAALRCGVLTYIANRLNFVLAQRAYQGNAQAGTRGLDTSGIDPVRKHTALGAPLADSMNLWGSQVGHLIFLVIQMRLRYSGDWVGGIEIRLMRASRLQPSKFLFQARSL